MSQLNRQDIHIVTSDCRLTNVLRSPSRSMIYFYFRQFLWVKVRVVSITDFFLSKDVMSHLNIQDVPSWLPVNIFIATLIIASVCEKVNVFTDYFPFYQNPLSNSLKTCPRHQPIPAGCGLTNFPSSFQQQILAVCSFDNLLSHQFKTQLTIKLTG